MLQAMPRGAAVIVALDKLPLSTRTDFTASRLYMGFLLARLAKDAVALRKQDKSTAEARADIAANAKSLRSEFEGLLTLSSYKDMFAEMADGTVLLRCAIIRIGFNDQLALVPPSMADQSININQ